MKPEKFAAAFEAAFVRLRGEIEGECAAPVDWPRRAAAAMRSGLNFAAAEPAAARVLTSDALAQGADGIARYERLIAYLAERLAPGREQRPHGDGLPEVTERALVGGVVTIVAQRVDRELEHELVGIGPEAIQFVLTPYLGAEEARRVAFDTALDSG